MFHDAAHMEGAQMGLCISQEIFCRAKISQDRTYAAKDFP
jgi:hypothetical protein